MTNKSTYNKDLNASLSFKGTMHIVKHLNCIYLNHCIVDKVDFGLFKQKLSANIFGYASIPINLNFSA